MATYKVLQDIEAEDKLLGPLTLKQFIFAILFIAIGFIEFKLFSLTVLGLVRWAIMLPLLVPFTVLGFLAAPVSRDQPNDVWLLARIQFLVKPHQRIWNQDGMNQLVTITVPKKIERIFTNGLNQNEVQSRLHALASTLDSRGWATKNVDVNLFTQPGYLSVDDGSDRLVAPSALPMSVMASDVRAADDMMDEASNPTAQHLEQMVQESTLQHQQQVRERIQNPQASQPTPADYWFMNQPTTPSPTLPVGMSTFQSSTVVAPGSDNTIAAAVPSAEEEAIVARVLTEKEHTEEYYPNLKIIQPLSSQLHNQTQPQPVAVASDYTPPSILPPIAPATVQKPPTTSGSITVNPAILNLANNDDLNVATIARQARQISEADDEVVISLH